MIFGGGCHLGVGYTVILFLGSTVIQSKPGTRSRPAGARPQTPAKGFEIPKVLAKVIVVFGLMSS